MNEALLEEGAWVFHTIKDFEYIVTSGRYSKKDIMEVLSNDAKAKLLVLLAEEAVK